MEIDCLNLIPEAKINLDNHIKYINGHIQALNNVIQYPCKS